MEYICMSTVENTIKGLPQAPGVYKMKDAKGKIIYIGKATSLRDRVSSYWSRPHDSRIEQLVAEIKDIDYQVTPTVIEALVLEANLIKKYLPKYNVKLRDDKSFLYLGITKEDFPRLVLLRGVEIEAAIRRGKTPENAGVNRRSARRLPASTKQLFGPYTSASSLRAALDILRKIFPYRSCETMPKRPCLFYQIKRCPAPCIGKISKKDYNYIIRQISLFFQGKKNRIIKNLELRMKNLANKEEFEAAGEIKRQIFALEHIRDVAIITQDDILPARKEKKDTWLNVFGRIEGYDISNTGGEQAVGSMVVFENGRAKKSDYRKFGIKTVVGANDIAMLREVLERRFRRIKNQEPCLPAGRSGIKDSKIHDSKFLIHNFHSWPRPDLILIDGGRGQVNAAEEVLRNYRLSIPVIGIAKGITRKKDEFIYSKFGKWGPELQMVASNQANLLKQVRDEAHRFAISFHRLRRKKKFLG